MEPDNSSCGGGTSHPMVKRAGSPEPSGVRGKRRRSRVGLDSGGGASDSGTGKQSAGYSEPSCVSVETNWSKDKPPYFSSESVPSASEQRCAEESAPRKQTHSVLEGTRELHEGFDHLKDDICQRHKMSMKNKHESLFEGNKTEENKTLLNTIYTQLYIIVGESDGVNEEHEMLQINKSSRKHLQYIPLNCSDIFKPVYIPKIEIEKGNIATEPVRALKERQVEGKENEGPRDQNLRAVLTKGIAGIGKTVSVQKFILDWAEGEASQDVDLMFVLPFRELNLIKDDQFSLHGLLCDFHPEIRDLDPKIYDDLRTVFIFDGLDESRIPLDFEECEKVSDVTMTSSVGALMMNLIRGDLLPSARIWITSRPAAANQIPPQHIDRVTEIQGFSDPQKDEYFRKRIRDEDQAQRIISHIKKARSLHIMCHIPVFCWISVTVLQRIIREPQTEIPQTLTEMYSHFLLTQIHMKTQKYEEKEERNPENLLESNRTVFLKLAELAFKQLMKGNVMFYEEDLRESGIDVIEASVYSGIFTEIFREEHVLHQRKIYCFVHLSFQEFLAALHVFHCFESKNMEELQQFKPWYREWPESVLLEELLERAVDKVLESQNGHLDLFLRFLLGISLESNQKLLQGLLTQTHHSSGQVIEHIKKLIKGNVRQKRKLTNKCLPTESSINLFLCLSEMKDQSLSREIQEFINSEKHSEEEISPGQCSALAYMLLTSGEVLDELDLAKFNTSEEGYRRLVPAVSVCRKALLSGSFLTVDSCETLCSALLSVNSLKELVLNNNDLQDSGVELLSAGLKSSHCKLETLSLAGCNLTKITCEKLASILQSEGSSLKDLDLSNNQLQDSGVRLLCAGLKSSHCKLETLRMAICNLWGETCKDLGSALQSANSSLKELDLSNNDLQDSGVELLSAGLKSSQCKLETLRLSGCMITEEGCSSLSAALQSNPSHLKELDLTYNHPGESGVKLLSARLEDPHCRLKSLLMEHGGKIRMKPGLKKYSCNLTLDPNTAHIHLSVSEGNRKVECVGEDQPYPDLPERFDRWLQVLSVEGLTGRCYWEAEWSVGADVALTYREIGRKGNSEDCGLGNNKQSWSLSCSDYSYVDFDFSHSYCIRHNKKRTAISAPPSNSSRVGVYLDWSAGTLSFYRVSSDTYTPSHLHTLHSTFTEPLYAGFGVGQCGASVCLCCR